MQIRKEGDVLKYILIILLILFPVYACGCSQEAKYKAWEEKWDNSEVINQDNEEVSESKPAEELNSGKLQSYNALDYGYITPMELQQREGDYPDVDWLYSAFKVMEANLIKQGKATKDTIDLSEGHYLYYAFRFPDKFSEDTTEDIVYVNSSYKLNTTDIFYKLRANTYFILMLADGVGPVSEERVPFDETNKKAVETSIEKLIEMEKQELIQEDMSDWLLTEINSLTMQDKDVVKDLILQNGAVQLGYDLSDMYLSPNGAYYSPYPARYITHTATVIGWDDTYSKTNFLEKYQPENDGAWLIYDSAASSLGKDGYLWVSYEDTTMQEVITYELCARADYGEILSYDKYGMGDDIKIPDADETVIANVFQMKEAKEIQAVGIYTLSDNQPVEINIYTNIQEGNPSGGTLSATTTVTPEWYGYHVIDLEQPVSVQGDSAFSVVVKYASGEEQGFAPLEGPVDESFMDPKVHRYVTSGKGQSYILYNGEWLDMSEDSTVETLEKDNPVNNACIKILLKKQ